MDKIEENKSIDRSEVQTNLYNALVEAYTSDKDLLSSYGDVLIIPSQRDDKDKDEEPSARSNQGTKRRRSGASRSQPTNLDESTHQEFNTGDNDVTPAREVQDQRQWDPSSSPTPDPE
ncbi:hypothetical protein Tco_0650564 [Tanacetum coccineum]